MAATLLLSCVLLCIVGPLVQATIPVNIGCSGTSNYKWINLVRTYSASICSYEIRPYNAFVCQLRVDFSTDLEQPEKILTPESLSPAPSCKPMSNIKIGSFTICGKNERQHLYIPFDGTGLFNTEPITANVNSGFGTYRIKVTQIECPFGLRRSMNSLLGYGGYGGLGSWSSNWYSNSAGANNNLLFDAYQVAPESCDQYHMSLHGVVESINFNSAQGPYPGGLQMKVCFKTLPKSRILRLTGLNFDLDANDGGSCDLADPFNPITSSDDYVSIPSSRILETGEPLLKYCGRILQGKTVESNLHETAHFIFNSGSDTGSAELPKRTYKFRYDIL